MGTVRSIYERKYSDDIYDLLVSGYLRRISNINECDNEAKKVTSRAYKVRLKVFKLCIDFYHKKQNENLIIWSGTRSDGNAKCNAVSLIKLVNHGANNKKHDIYKLNIHNLDDNNFCNVEWNVNFDRSDSSFCLLSNMNISQMRWITNKCTSFREKPHDIIIRIGAKDQNKSRADALIFDPYSTTNNMHLIEAYYSSEITTFPRMPFISNTTLVQNDQFIFGYGGTLRNGNIWNNIYSLNVNNLKYRRYAQLSQAKYGVSLTANDDLFILGGSNKNCHVFNIESNEIKQISDLNMKRIYCGSAYFHNNKGKIVVGGGCNRDDNDRDYDASNCSLEICDLHKNKWNVLQCKTNKMHSKYPSIWNDKINGNIVYIAGDKTRNNLVKNLGFIEWCDVRENKKKFNVLFNNQPINHLFDLTKKRNTDKLNWISRALII